MYHIDHHQLSIRHHPPPSLAAHPAPALGTATASIPALVAACVRLTASIAPIHDSS